MSISYEGIGYFAVTFPDNGSEEGLICKVDNTGCAAACSAGDLFCGVALEVKNGMAAVQTDGFITTTFTGTTPACGWGYFVADGNGGVKLSSNGLAHLVTGVDTMTGTITMRL